MTAPKDTHFPRKTQTVHIGDILQCPWLHHCVWNADKTALVPVEHITEDIVSDESRTTAWFLVILVDVIQPFTPGNPDGTIKVEMRRLTSEHRYSPREELVRFFLPYSGKSQYEMILVGHWEPWEERPFCKQNKGYTPKLYYPDLWDNYVEILLNLDRCPNCQRLMLPRLDVWEQRKFNFPMARGYDLESQMKNAGFVYKGGRKPGSYDFNSPYCEECTAQGLITFTCACCGQERNSSLVHEVKYETEVICSICYETKTAKEYQEFLDKLADKHYYD